MPRRTQNGLSIRALRILIVTWSSFAVAAVATMLFFATFDPVLLAEMATFPFGLSRFAGYTIGFFLIWLLAASASAISIFLAESLHDSSGSTAAQNSPQ